MQAAVAQLESGVSTSSGNLSGGVGSGMASGNGSTAGNGAQSGSGNIGTTSIGTTVSEAGGGLAPGEREAVSEVGSEKDNEITPRKRDKTPRRGRGGS